MTPLQSALSRILPKPLVLPALAAIYAVLILGVMFAAASVVPIIYLDIGSN